MQPCVACNHLGRISHLEEQVEEARLEREKLIGTLQLFVSS